MTVIDFSDVPVSAFVTYRDIETAV